MSYKRYELTEVVDGEHPDQAVKRLQAAWRNARVEDLHGNPCDDGHPCWEITKEAAERFDLPSMTAHKLLSGQIGYSPTDRGGICFSALQS